MAYTTINDQFLISGYLQDIDNNEDYSLNGCFRMVGIQKDFLNAIYPKFSVVLIVTQDIYDIIQKNNVKLALKIESFSALDAIEDEENDTPIVEDVVVNTILRLYDKNLTKVAVKSDDDAETEEESPIENQKYQIQLIGYPDKILELNDEIVNDVYANASMDEILTDIYGQNNSLYLDSSDNKQREETLLIPPMNIAKAIDYLQSNYGIYDTDVLHFFDVDKTYICKRFSSAEGYYENILDIQVQEISDSSSTTYTNIQVDDENNLKKVLDSAPVYTSIKDVNDNLIGGTAIFGSYGSEFELVSRTYERDKNNSKVRYYWNTNKSDLFEKAAVKSTSIQSAISLSNLNPSYITPKTRVNINCEDELCKGSYDISEMRVSFSSGNMKTYTGNILLTIIK